MRRNLPLLLRRSPDAERMRGKPYRKMLPLTAALLQNNVLWHSQGKAGSQEI